ncbi:hypothetical protein [Nitrosospira multiformis]|nr:hypothetical protein [Nitrosospira multiformis]SDZ97862.1 hypothetical protein SAMN05216411_103172 [Nitrosospira multiformis]
MMSLAVSDMARCRARSISSSEETLHDALSPRLPLWLMLQLIVLSE